MKKSIEKFCNEFCIMDCNDDCPLHKFGKGNSSYLEGAEVDKLFLYQDVYNPENIITTEEPYGIIQKLYDKSDRVLGKFIPEDGGKMVICRLDKHNTNNYNDFYNAKADLTGADGDVFTLIPEFYYLVTRLTEDNYIVEYSFKKFHENAKLFPKTLIGTYEGTMSNGRLYSISGVSSSEDFSQSEFSKMAARRGNGYSLVTWDMHCMMSFLFYAKYKTTNFEDVMFFNNRAGYYEFSRKTGGTNVIGMCDTYGNIHESGSLNFWGVENWCGNKSEWLQDLEFSENGELIVGRPGKKRVILINPFKRENGFVTKMSIGEYFDLIPIEVKEKESTFLKFKYEGYCSYMLKFTAANQGCGFTRSGGVDGRGDRLSTSYIHQLYKDCHSQSIGGRLCYRGPIIEEKDIAKFKSLYVVN